MPGKMFIEGEDVNLRTIEEEDAQFLRNGVNHPEVRIHMGNRRPQNLENEKDFIENAVQDEDDVNLLICKEDEAMGIISLKQKDKASKLGEIGIWLHPDYHGNGYGTEASKLVVEHGFEQLNYHKLYARAHSDNEASKSIWRKHGFQKEGEFKDHVYTEGEYRDVVYYGLLEEDRL
ncbi:hypothetical protein AQV86_03815 [Nanohaloarchaea archaeon SG9]|nr:hypothetical protein AQV86_03815 [Nanohaloarchaea archaeon SG9]